jgi:hypothetical protein
LHQPGGWWCTFGRHIAWSVLLAQQQGWCAARLPLLAVVPLVHDELAGLRIHRQKVERWRPQQEVVGSLHVTLAGHPEACCLPCFCLHACSCAGVLCRYAVCLHDGTAVRMLPTVQV